MALTKVTGSVWETDSNSMGINVKDHPYLATGNGSTDDSAAIQAAITAAAGGVVWIPNGTYVIGTSLDMGAAGVTILGESRWNTILKAGSSFTGNILHNASAGTGNSGLHYVSNMFFDLNGESCTGIDLTNINNSTFINLRFEGGANLAGHAGVGVMFSAHASRLQGSYSNQVINCDFTALSYGVQFKVGGNHNTITGGEFINCMCGVRTQSTTTNGVDTPKIFGSRFEGCGTGIYEGASYGEYHGLRFENNDQTITTPKTITGITDALPPVVTSTSHGFSNDDIVFLNLLNEATNLNGNGYIVKNKTTNTFELFEPGDFGSITAFADGSASKSTVTSAAHGLSDGDVVLIYGTTNYNGNFTVSSSTTNTFKINDAYVADDATGTWYNSSVAPTAAETSSTGRIYTLASGGLGEICFTDEGTGRKSDHPQFFGGYTADTVPLVMNMDNAVSEGLLMLNSDLDGIKLIEPSASRFMHIQGRVVRSIAGSALPSVPSGNDYAEYFDDELWLANNTWIGGLNTSGARQNLLSMNASNQVQIGDTTDMVYLASLAGSATWNPGSIAAGNEEAKNVTVTGAALGDFCMVSFSLDVADLVLSGEVTASNTVTAVLANNTGGAVDLGSGTLRAKVIK